jgi:hypothetical protein
MRSAENEAVTSVASRSLFFFFSAISRFERTKFSAGDAQPASDDELCRRGMKREVDLRMPL